MTFYDKVADQHRTTGYNQIRRLLGDTDPDYLRLVLAATDERLAERKQPAPALTSHRDLNALTTGGWELEGARRALVELIEEKQS